MSRSTYNGMQDHDDGGNVLTQGDMTMTRRDKPLPSPTPMQNIRHNVLLFGETGVGKSSIINMLSGKEVAHVSNGATGCTFSSKPYATTLAGKEFILWDTVGLNEGDFGRTPSDQAARALEDLMRTVEGGLSLLVYVMRGTRFREILRLNYELFYCKICEGKVPVVVIITGLENEQLMDSWWDDNKSSFRSKGMKFGDKACITTIRGKPMRNGGHMFDEEYEDSERKVKELIAKNFSREPVRIARRARNEIMHSTGRNVGFNGGHEDQVQRRSASLQDPTGMGRGGVMHSTGIGRVGRNPRLGGHYEDGRLSLIEKIILWLCGL